MIRKGNIEEELKKKKKPITEEGDGEGDGTKRPAFAPTPEPVVPEKPIVKNPNPVISGGMVEKNGQTFLGPNTQEIAQAEGLGTGVIQPGGLNQPAQAQVTGALEQAGAFETVTPTETDLGPSTETLDIPIVGPAGGGIVDSILENSLINKWVDKQFPQSEAAGEAFPVPMTPETLREAALREIRNDSFKEGVSISQTFGSFIEAIPIVGKAASSWASGLIETPSSNSKNVIDEINKMKEAASTGQEKVRNGLEDPDYGLDRARKMEEDVAKLEGRLKLLIGTSAILRANTDEINKIQEQVLETKEKISRYKQASIFGLTAQLTGTGRIIPTDEQLFFELQRLKT